MAKSRPRLAQQRLRQPSRGVLLHDPRRPLGAEHPLVQRMIRIALNVANLTIPQRHPNPATAGAHITGRVLHLDSGVVLLVLRPHQQFSRL